MSNFFAFESDKTINYFFTLNHFLILFISLVIIVFFSMYACRQKFKFQKIFVIVSVVLLYLLEIGRLIYQYFYLTNNNLKVNFLNLTQLDYFTFALYLSLPMFIIALIIKSKNKSNHNILILNFIFYITTLIAIINFIYPSFLNSNFEFYHFYNLCSILIRSLTIMLGFFFIFAKWFKIEKFLDLFKPLICLALFGVSCIIVYFIFGVNLNLFFMEYVPMFENLGIYLNFPLNLILIGIFVFLLQILMFIPFKIYKKVKDK